MSPIGAFPSASEGLVGFRLPELVLTNSEREPKHDSLIHRVWRCTQDILEHVDMVVIPTSTTSHGGESCKYRFGYRKKRMSDIRE